MSVFLVKRRFVKFAWAYHQKKLIAYHPTVGSLPLMSKKDDTVVKNNFYCKEQLQQLFKQDWFSDELSDK